MADLNNAKVLSGTDGSPEQPPAWPDIDGMTISAMRAWAADMGLDIDLSLRSRQDVVDNLRVRYDARVAEIGLGAGSGTDTPVAAAAELAPEPEPAPAKPAAARTRAAPTLPPTRYRVRVRGRVSFGGGNIQWMDAGRELDRTGYDETTWQRLSTALVLDPIED